MGSVLLAGLKQNYSIPYTPELFVVVFNDHHPPKLENIIWKILVVEGNPRQIVCSVTETMTEEKRTRMFNFISFNLIIGDLVLRWFISVFIHLCLADILPQQPAWLIGRRRKGSEIQAKR
jgi:hypothetical protein